MNTYFVYIVIADRMQYIDIYVTEGQDEEIPNGICYTIYEEGAVDFLHINCTRPIIGRYVKLRQHANYSDISITMNICEVQVYGYPYRGKTSLNTNVLTHLAISTLNITWEAFVSIIPFGLKDSIIILYDYNHITHIFKFLDCPDDYFGVACGIPCNCQVPCDDITGECPGQKCVEGWGSKDCQTGEFYWLGLSLIPARISNQIPWKVWNEITYPFPNFNAVEV